MIRRGHGRKYLLLQALALSKQWMVRHIIGAPIIRLGHYIQRNNTETSQRMTSQKEDHTKSDNYDEAMAAVLQIIESDSDSESQE